MENEVMFIKLDDIIPNRFQPREVFDEDALNKLADSIRKHGVIEPIVVRPVSNKYEIVVGERRYKASVLAGLTKIPAIVKQMDDKESSIVAYIENEHRSGVSAIEEARTIDRILKSNNMTQEELAGELGINQSTLANKLRLLSLPMEIQNALMHSEISERHARSLLSVKNEAQQIELLNKIKTNKMTVRELESEIKNMNNDTNNFSFNEPNNGTNSFLGNYDNIVQASIPNPSENVNVGSLANEYLNNSQSDNSDNGFMNYLNNYDNNNSIPKVQVSPEASNPPMEEDQGFMKFLNNYDNNNPVSETPVTQDASNPPMEEDQGFMNFLNSYDNNNPVSETTATQEASNPPMEEDQGFMNFLNNYDSNNPLSPTDLDNLTPEDNSLNNFNEPVLNENNYLNSNFTAPVDNNVVINDVNPPITSGFDSNSYVESNPNFVDVSKDVVISDVDEIIGKVKTVVDEIKATSKYKIDTDEIDYDDLYQITIKIDKKDF